ncbi:MAG: TRAP transporter small permease [Rhodobacteraceae bacterium]|nr:MAG: TRAP transporter small permease [Paracoccaceae bacterium]
MTTPFALRLLDRVTVILALVAGVAVAFLAFLIVFDIAARSLFRFSVQGTDELGGYTLALTGSLGLAYTLIRRGHPRIDIGFRLFPLKLRRALHVLALATLTVFALFMTQHALSEFRTTLTFGSVTNTPLKTPLWVPQIFWVTGTGFFALTGFVLTLHGVLLLATGKGAQVEKRYGPVTIEEELEEFLHSEALTESSPAERKD